MAETVVQASAPSGASGPERSEAAAPFDSSGSQPPRLSGRNGYSLFVSSMKLLLPALAAGLVLLVIAWPQIMPDVSRSGLNWQKVARDHAKTLNMLNARYSGVDENNQPFSIAADLATQAPENEDIVELQHPKADIRTTDGDLVALSARRGNYDRKGETLDLAGSVKLTHDRGFDVVTEAARVDLKDGSAAGDSPVTGDGPTGELQSEGFRLRERGQIIIFTGKSRLLIYPDAKEKLSKQGGAAGAAQEASSREEEDTMETSQ